MFSVDKYSNIMYRGVSLSSNHPAALDDPCYMLPEDQLHEIDARDIPDFDCYDFMLLPNAKSIISSKCDYHCIRIRKVNEQGVLLELVIHTENGWNEPLSPDMLFFELENIFKKMTDIKIEIVHIDPETPIFNLNIILFVPSFNLKEVYDAANELLIDVEMKAYKNVLKIAIDNL